MNNTVLKKPLVSEKSFSAASSGVYIFNVKSRANKSIIATEVEKIFKVKVLKVNIINIPGKVKKSGKKIGQRANIKKAYVRVAKGQKIAIFEEEKKSNQKKETSNKMQDTNKSQISN